MLDKHGWEMSARSQSVVADRTDNSTSTADGYQERREKSRSAQLSRDGGGTRRRHRIASFPPLEPRAGGGVEMGGCERLMGWSEMVVSHGLSHKRVRRWGDFGRLCVGYLHRRLRVASRWAGWGVCVMQYTQLSVCLPSYLPACLCTHPFHLNPPPTPPNPSFPPASPSQTSTSASGSLSLTPAPPKPARHSLPLIRQALTCTLTLTLPSPSHSPIPPRVQAQSAPLPEFAVRKRRMSPHPWLRA